MNVLKPAKKRAVLHALVEGCSIRATSRMTSVHKTTILKVLVEVGDICAYLLDEHIRKLQCEAIECDEIWTFVGKKERRLSDEDRLKHPEYGDQYVFVAFDPASKLVPSFAVGHRDGQTALHFMHDLRSRIDGRLQISTDGFDAYPEAIDRAFGRDADYAQVIKHYEAGMPGRGRYSPPHVTDVTIRYIAGEPTPQRICTSYVERNNLTIRMQMRRFTRLTNAFSKKLDNLRAALSLHFWYYNFCRIHSSIKVTPAMEAGITNRLWNLEEVIA